MHLCRCARCRLPSKAGWLPTAWVYLFCSWRRLWGRLNGGDRFVLVAVLIGGAAATIYIGAKVTQAAMRLSHMALDFVPGLFALVVVTLAMLPTLVTARASHFFAYIPETTARRRTRFLCEFALSSCLGTILLSAIIISVPALAHMRSILLNLVILISGFVISHLIQSLMLQKGALNHTGSIGSKSKRHALDKVLTLPILAPLAHTSSRFLLKMNTNPLIWLLFAFVLVSGFGAALTMPSILVAISTLSQAVLVIQMTLMEPRVGNGVTIGAHSRFLPINRAFADWMALVGPHMSLFVIAGIFIWSHQSWLEFYVAITQLVLTLWLIWMALIMKAQDAPKMTRALLIFGVVAMVAGNAMPPLILPILIICTILITRDLMRLSKEGPATWPR
jgi:hypothetical protein